MPTVQIILFYIFLEKIMSDTLEYSDRIGGRILINFRFADEIIANAEEEEEAYDI